MSRFYGSLCMLTSPPLGVRSTAMSASVCLCARISQNYTSKLHDIFCTY